MRNCIALALCVLVAGCGGTGGSSMVPEIPPPTPEELAVQDYERIAGNANLQLATDRLNWVPGETEPDRVSVECRGPYCSVGYSAFLRADKVVSVDTGELTLLSDTNGISTLIENYVGSYSEAHNYGGWMEYSFFASSARIFTSELDPDEGVIQVAAYANGHSIGTNPEMEATWSGFVTARDDTAGTNRASHVVGDASISVGIDTQVLVDVHFTDMANATTGQAYSDISFEDMPAIDGQFSRYVADEDRLSGTFYGPNHEEVGGVFEGNGLLGSFGGQR